jgi:phage gp29-like protein
VPSLAPTSPRLRELQYSVEGSGWTPDRVTQAFQSAEGGILSQLSDLVETMLTDDRIDGVLSTRTHGLLGLPLRFEQGDTEARDWLASGEWTEMHPESELVRLLQWGIVGGVGLAQRIPLPRLVGEKQRYYLETWSPRWLSWDHMANAWRVQTTKGPELVAGPRWVLFEPYGSNRPWAAGKWRSLAFPWLLKRFALEDRANFSEVLGTPTRVGMAPQGATDPQRKAFQSKLKNLGRNGVITLPDGWDFKVVESGGSTVINLFAEEIAWADQAITIVLAGQIVTTEGTQGFSSGVVQDRIRGELIRFDAERLAATLHEQSLKPWAMLNWGSFAAAPRLHWNTERPTDLLNQATTYETLSRAIKGLNEALVASGSEIDTAALATKYGIPVMASKQEVARVQLQLAPTDIARIARVKEARASQGLAPLGDERDDLFLHELETIADAEAEIEVVEAEPEAEPAKPEAAE